MNLSFKFPHYLIIGAQKAGTSWVHRCIREHPDIFTPRGKHDDCPLGRPPYTDDNETAFFDAFTAAGTNQVIADTSVDYLYRAEACAPVIIRYMPDCKFIVFLRNPADRAISACMWSIRVRRIKPSSMEDGIRRALDTLEREDSQANTKAAAPACFYRAIIERGFYADQLETYFQYFKPENFLIVFYDDLRASAATVMENVYDFMGADPYYRAASFASRPKQSVNYHAAMAEAAVRRVTRRMPVKLNRFLFAAIAAVFGRIDKDNPRNKISDGLSSELADIFRGRNRQLAELLKNQPCRVVSRQTLFELPEIWNGRQTSTTKSIKRTRFTNFT